MQFGQLNIPKIDIEPFMFIQNFQTRIYVQYSEVVEKTDVGKFVVKMLSDDPRVIALYGKMISCGSGSQMFETKTLAMWFLWCANEYGIEKAQNYLESFLDSEKISVINALWVLGIEVDQPIPLKDGYVIQSVHHMPDSREKEIFLQTQLGYVLQNTPVSRCAITKTCLIQKTKDNEVPATADDDPEFWKISRQLYDIALLLNTLSDSFCVPYFSTSYVDHTIPFGPFAGSGGGSPIYDVIAHGSNKLHYDLKDTIGLLMTKYNNMNEPKKTKIQRILNRLSQAKRRTQIEDKILDLGIVLEMLLLDDNSNHDQLSLSFRLRGAWLLGKSAEDRLKKYNHLRNLYTYRSQVAHSGMLCKGRRAEINKVQQSFSEYQSLAENICQKMILEGEPDWNKLILGFSESTPTNS